MRIAFLSHLDLNLYLFRLSWMRALAGDGHEVFAITPRGAHFDSFARHGVQAVPWKMERGRTNLFSALSAYRDLKSILAEVRPDMVHAFTLQTSLYAALVGRKRISRKVFLHITGLGYIYTEDSPRARLLRAVLSPVCRGTFRRAERVVFQNPDDMSDFRHIVPEGKGAVIKGTGVDTDYYDSDRVDISEVEALREEIGVPETAVVVTLIARLLYHKGLREFLEAARTLKAELGSVSFLVVGWIDEGNPAAVSRSFIEEAGREGAVRFLGWREDIREILTLTDIYCLPSYREGTPRTVLEAMSMGKTVVTTDAPGCRQTVEKGRTGILVPPRDGRKLADALRSLIEDRGLRERMGREGREKVLREFSDDVVIEKVRELHEGILPRDD